MGSLWCKIKNADNRKKHTLYSLGIGSVFFVLLFIISNFFSFTLCPIKSIFGISCFGCGMTRGFISIINFDFKSAFEYNVLSIPLFIGIVLYSIFSYIDIIFDKNYILFIEKQLSKKYMLLIFAVILIFTYTLNNT